MKTYLVDGEYMQLTGEELLAKFDNLIKNESWNLHSKIQASWFGYGDIYQEMLMEFFDSLEGYDISKGHFSTYLTWRLKSQAKNIIQYLTAEKRNDPQYRIFDEMDDNISDCTDPSGLGESYWSKQGLKAIVDALKMQEREKALTLYMSECMEAGAVAERLNVKKASVYKMAYEYKKVLKREIPKIEGYEHLEVV